MASIPRPHRAALWGAVTALIILAACDGPHEKTGRDADRAAAAAGGQNQTGEGPNERLGEAQDRVERANAKANAARAAALERQGDQLRTEADLAADRFDEQARSLRDNKARPTSQ